MYIEKIRLVWRKMHHNVLSEMQNTRKNTFLSVLNASQVALNIRINFSPVVCSLFLSSQRLRSASVRTRMQTSTGICNLSKRELLGPAGGLSRGALNFIVIYLVYIAHSNKDNKAMRKTVGLNRALNFRLQAVSSKQT